MADPDWLRMLGINVLDVCAGVAGGVVNAFVFKRSQPMAILGSIVVGALTANYLGEPAAYLIKRYVGPYEGAAAFIVGLCAMAICQAIVEAVSKWRPTKGSLK